MKIFHKTGILFFTILFHLVAVAQQPDYKNPKLAVEKRVADLLSRMTVEEKVEQLRTLHPDHPVLNDSLFNNSSAMDTLFKNGIGMMNSSYDLKPETVVANRNKLQNYLTTKTRLGIPTIFINEGHHGLVNLDVNVFPQAIGFACSWDPAFIETVYDFIAREASARGTNLFFAPNLDVCRDPRWGRTGETFGEDPYLNGMLGAAAVRGFQGSSDGTIAPDHVAATLKHFVGYGQPEGGLNQSPANYSIRVLREFLMESFRLCIKNSKPAAVMPSYNEVDGIPSHANKWLLKDVLRKEWGFGGLVISDWYGIDQLWKKHHVEATEKDAALRAFKSGVTMDTPDGVNYSHLVELVRENKISMEELNAEVSRVLTLKFNLGLFENKIVDAAKAKKISSDVTGRKLALKAAEESMVLLKNQDNLLPIKKDQFKKIALIGPCAATNYLGDYSGVPVKNVSLLEGLKNKAGDKCEILYSKGCMLTKNGDTVSMRNFDGDIDTTIFPSHEENRKLIMEAVEVARQSEFIIVAVGENEQLCRESWMSGHFGDAFTLDLLSDQEELVKELIALKKPVLVYLMHGRPLSINWISENVPAIIDGWYMGQEAGNAFANILFGETCPSGKLTITYPRSVGQIPMYYNHKPSAQYFDYTTGKPTPLFPFGYGLSYTTFEYSNLRLSKNEMKVNDSVTVEIDITNTGKMKGDEIVQLYIHDKVSSATRPVMELKDFSRISLAPGEKKTVSFKIESSKLAFWNADMNYIVEPGVFEIEIGRSSGDVQKIDLTVVN